jgi:hypothetical protein
MVFNTTFNNISVISWWLVLLVEETGVLCENHWPVTRHWQTLSHNVVLSTPCHEPVQTHNFCYDRHRCLVYTGSKYIYNVHLVDGIVKSVWFRQLFGLLRVRFHCIWIFLWMCIRCCIFFMCSWKLWCNHIYMWKWRVLVMVFNTTLNNISVLSWCSVLFVEETGVPGEIHRPLVSHWQTLSVYT